MGRRRATVGPAYRLPPLSFGRVDAQANVDTETHLILAQHVTDHTNDKQEVGPALERLDALPEVLGAVDALLADTGYHSQENLERCAAAGIDPYIPEARQRHNPPLAERLADDPPAPQGQPTPAEATAHRLRARARRAMPSARPRSRPSSASSSTCWVSANSCCAVCVRCRASGCWCVWDGTSSAFLRLKDEEEGKIARCGDKY